MIEGNLELTFTNVFFVAEEMSFDDEEEEMKAYTHIGFCVMIGFWLIFAFVLPLWKRDKLQDDDMVEKYGAMYEDIKTDSALPAVYSAVFSLRRALMIFALLYLR
mmetsp:Transcript_26034/g.34835  ORF Transcript_26034/g.34835 Transcript_26034/m.34835 type:complete len:105 (+) Transcript_26034:254-568(+)